MLKAHESIRGDGLLTVIWRLLPRGVVLVILLQLQLLLLLLLLIALLLSVPLRHCFMLHVQLLPICLRYISWRSKHEVHSRKQARWLWN